MRLVGSRHVAYQNPDTVNKALAQYSLTPKVHAVVVCMPHTSRCIAMSKGHVA